MGQVPPGTVVLVETKEDAERVEVPDPARVAYATQTTLSVFDTAEIVEILKRRFPAIEGPRREDICYATTNRQMAVAEVAKRADLVLVVGAPNSSNSLRLVEVARRSGCPRAELVRDAGDIHWSWFAGVGTLGLTAGASAPEHLVQGVIEACRERFTVTVAEMRLAEEDVVFRVPPLPRRAPVRS
ncbi:4-hydroxy-3-methylbut-2-enyl diphosphate reductase [bacterium HR39]|nr:4-hydroxy-3-methylbut-2-enyl diphosphate reductase [bacterium HR39]